MLPTAMTPAARNLYPQFSRGMVGHRQHRVKADRADGLRPLRGAALDLAAIRGAQPPSVRAIHGKTVVCRAFAAIEYRTELCCVPEGGRRCATGVDRLTMPDVGLL